MGSLDPPVAAGAVPLTVDGHPVQDALQPRPVGVAHRPVAVLVPDGQVELRRASNLLSPVAEVGRVGDGVRVVPLGPRPPAFVAFQPVVRYLLGPGPLSGYLLAWPTASVLYLLGVGSACLALVGREDRRVTAGLFALAGLDLLYFAVAFSSVRLRVVALPVGVAVLWLAAWASRPSRWLG